MEISIFVVSSVFLAVAIVLWRYSNKHPGHYVNLAFWGAVGVFDVLRLAAATGWERFGWALVVVGSICNATVTIANRGYMPCAPKDGWSPKSVWKVIDADSRLTFLGDIIPLYGRSSIGDVFISAGALILIPASLVFVVKLL